MSKVVLGEVGREEVRVSWHVKPLRFSLVAGGLAIALVSASAMAQPARSISRSVEAQIVGPIPVTADSHPLLAGGDRIKRVDYVEEEFFLSGEASVYDWTGAGHAVKIVAGPGHYTTRLLVRRPRDPARFSGNVEVAVLNASLGVDLGSATDFDRSVKQGDVWIGITSKALSAGALKKFDPRRYAAINWSNPAPSAGRCLDPSIIPAYMIGSQQIIAMMAKMGIAGSAPATEDGLIWDMLGQLGLLLKSDRRNTILPNFGVPHLYMTGVSQSALYVRTWIAAFHDLYRTPDGKPIYDGYFGVVGPALLRINQCAQDVALADPRQKLGPLDVPFISISSEGEMWQARYTRQQNTLARRSGIVSYEVAGASHNPGEVPGVAPDLLAMPAPADLAKAGVKVPAAGGGSAASTGAYPNDFVWAPAIRAAYHNLQVWVRNGIRPPLTPSIELDDRLEIVRDSAGNALGGLRMPYITVPTASHQGYISAGGIGGVTGIRRPFSATTLKALYPTHASYVAKFDAATDRLRKARLILPADASAMKDAATLAPVPDAAGRGAL